MPTDTSNSRTSESTPNTTRNNNANNMLFRGGFSTSLCGLFQHHTVNRSDCCALACCGVLLSDRNRYLLLEERPPPWWRRLLINVGLPLVLFLVLIRLLQEYSTPETQGLWSLGILVVMVFLVTGLLYQARRKRRTLRVELLKRLYQERVMAASNSSTSSTSSTAPQSQAIARVSVENYLALHNRDTWAAHATCGCYSKDFAGFDASYAPLTREGDATSRIATTQSPPPQDLCNCLWQTVKNLCCGWCCGTWCQCCGMCAIGQEDREIQRLLATTSTSSLSALQMDYITFEPYCDYFTKLQDLREHYIASFARHLSQTSKLSQILLRMLACALLLLALIALSNLDKNFTLLNLMVVLATFLQAFFILYLVHWRWNRFDLSLDAVIKYFSSGFVLCTAIAVLYEMLISIALSVIGYIVVAIRMAAEGDTPDDVPQDEKGQKEYMKEFAKENVWLFVIMVFLNAFVVAALVEELTKYFGFWMVEHPDFMDPQELATRNQQDVLEEEEEGMSSVVPASLHKRPLASLGKATTIAMVATALGFACCENLLYVFVYTPPSVSNEIATLVARSLFPVHPLAAAIQSIGVCQRDLEENRGMGLGRILLPAVVLHGAFDFCLMLLALLQGLYSDESEATDDATDAQQEQVTWQDLKAEVPALVMSVVIMIWGAIYYVAKARSQRTRLEELDRGRQGGGSSLLV